MSVERLLYADWMLRSSGILHSARGCERAMGGVDKVCAGGLPDRSAINAVIDEPFVQSGEHLIDRAAGRELDDKESEK
jgi:hypothetical protein